MKYIYNKSKFIREDVVIDVQSAITFFVDTPILLYTNEAQARIGTIDLMNSKEYLMPIHLNNVIINDLYLFKESVNFIPHASDPTNFLRSNLQILFEDKQYGPNYKWENVEFKYIRLENFDFFLNIIIPFINWGLNNYQNDVDLILFFSVLLLKRDILENKKSHKHNYPYLSNLFLNNITITNEYKSETRVGREDYEYGDTHIIFEPKIAEEYYYLKLIAKEFALKNYTPTIRVKKSNKLVDISFRSYFDNGIHSTTSSDSAFTGCNIEKEILIKKHDELYGFFFEKFESLYEKFIKYQKRKKYNEYEYDYIIRSMKKTNDILDAKNRLYKEVLLSHNIPIPEFDERSFINKLDYDLE